jgi:hypothetical protein
MRSIESPANLLAAVSELFPGFETELDDEEAISYHNIVSALTPLLSGYLQGASKRRVEAFCDLINTMVAAGGDKENAVSTCLLEHASQVKVRRILQPYLSAGAKKELR